ncbi:MAG: hypothetical protein GMKNLPBB_00776 [Myxococcota bacterium]|nr:hypothetical protein [Myxococcota bacterium]
MVDPRQELGRRSEDAACRWLADRGFRILERNYRTRFGEVDIIAESEGFLCFIEVRSRGGPRLENPAHSIGAHKQQQVLKAAMQYLASRSGVPETAAPPAAVTARARAEAMAKLTRPGAAAAASPGLSTPELQPRFDVITVTWRRGQPGLEFFPAAYRFDGW